MNGVYSRLASQIRGLGYGGGRSVDRVSILKESKIIASMLSCQEYASGGHAYYCPPYFCTARGLATGNSSVRKPQGDESALDTDRLIPSIQRHLEMIADRHASLVQQSLSPEASTMSNEEISRLNKDIAELSTAVEFKRQFDNLRTEIHGLEQLLEEEEEEEMLRLAQEEMETLKSNFQELQNGIIVSLLPKDPADDKGCVLEVRAGAGGEEACLFAKDLFGMYQRYANNRPRWKFEIVESSDSESGGYKLAIATISGPSAYGTLKYESGVHRVQRVPTTESSGRIHTSAASVTILPQAEELDLHIREEDLRIDVYRSSGAGGQHVNTTNSAVRITHLPSGIVVAIQDERSQHKNKAKALSLLRARLYDAERRKLAEGQSSSRKQQIGTGDRSERVRTYNFPQGRITDHRIGYTEHDMDRMLRGELLDDFISRLHARSTCAAAAEHFAAGEG